MTVLTPLLVVVTKTNSVAAIGNLVIGPPAPRNLEILKDLRQGKVGPVVQADLAEWAKWPKAPWLKLVVAP